MRGLIRQFGQAGAPWAILVMLACSLPLAQAAAPFAPFAGVTDLSTYVGANNTQVLHFESDSPFEYQMQTLGPNEIVLRLYHAQLSRNLLGDKGAVVIPNVAGVSAHVRVPQKAGKTPDYQEIVLSGTGLGARKLVVEGAQELVLPIAALPMSPADIQPMPRMATQSLAKGAKTAMRAEPLPAPMRLDRAITRQHVAFPNIDTVSSHPQSTASNAAEAVAMMSTVAPRKIAQPAVQYMSPDRGGAVSQPGNDRNYPATDDRIGLDGSVTGKRADSAATAEPPASLTASVQTLAAPLKGTQNKTAKTNAPKKAGTGPQIVASTRLATQVPAALAAPAPAMPWLPTVNAIPNSGYPMPPQQTPWAESQGADPGLAATVAGAMPEAGAGFPTQADWPTELPETAAPASEAEAAPPPEMAPQQPIPHYHGGAPPIQAVTLNPQGQPVILKPAHAAIADIDIQNPGSNGYNTLFQADAPSLPPQAVNRLMDSALTHYRAGDYAGALADIRNAMRDEPQNGDLQAALGEIEIKLSHPQSALSAYAKAHQLSKGKYDLRYAQVLALSGQRADAIRMLEDINRTHPKQAPKQADIAFLLGTLHEEAGQVTEALSYLKQAAQLRPGSADIQYNLGLALELSGNRAEAEQHYRKALSLNPGAQDIAMALERLHNN